MQLSTSMKGISLAVAVAWMVGCSSPTTVTEEGNAGSGTAGTGTGGVTTGTGAGSGVSGTGVGTPVDVSSLQTVFYFDFDQSSLRSDSIADLEAHARYLASHPSASVRLEGHADERGSREYNMALGERRAKAVERFLAVNGVSGMQAETISYGEEKPAMLGAGEGSWSQNRRVELKYVNY